MTNVIPFPVQPPQGEFLPITLGGGEAFQCSRCPVVFSPQTWHVEPGAEDVDGNLVHGNPICPACALDDPQLSMWQRYCDILDAVDTLMQQAHTFNRRSLLTSMLGSNVGHMARWRSPDEAEQWDRWYAARSADVEPEDEE